MNGKSEVFMIIVLSRSRKRRTMLVKNVNLWHVDVTRVQAANVIVLKFCKYKQCEYAVWKPSGKTFCIYDIHVTVSAVYAASNKVIAVVFCMYNNLIHYTAESDGKLRACEGRR